MKLVFASIVAFAFVANVQTSFAAINVGGIIVDLPDLPGSNPPTRFSGSEASTRGCVVNIIIDNQTGAPMSYVFGNEAYTTGAGQQTTWTIKETITGSDCSKVSRNISYDEYYDAGVQNREYRLDAGKTYYFTAIGNWISLHYN